MLTYRSAAPGRNEEGPPDCSVDTPHEQLSIFLGNSLWWPPQLTSPSNRVEEAATCAEGCTPSKVDQQRLYCLRQLLTKARFEEVDACMHARDLHGSADAQLGLVVPPCFAVFTRFNCNVTLVAQRLFACKLNVQVLDSGQVEVQDDAILQVLKHATKGELIYRRHVMLSLKDQQEHNCMHFMNESFSYGFLSTFLNALPDKARKLVLSETLPFGYILDHCGIRRAVEVDKQLHIHIDDGFFNEQSTSPRMNNDFTDRVTSREIIPNNVMSSTSLEGECLCRMLREGERCTFGRLTTVFCDDKPAARVVEILNNKVVLCALSLAEREAMNLNSLACCLNDKAVEERVALLTGRCMLSVAKCPVHSHLLPKPHVRESQLLAPREKDEGCRLCGSQTCSTDFHAEYTADIV
ncbi:hypothetical protein Emed_006676 [Eimeria media]